MSTHEEAVVVTIESIGKAVEMLFAETDALRAENRALANRIESVMRFVSDPGRCEHGISFAPGRAINGRSQWCGECFPE